jgi:hypothetical protein
VFWVEEQNTAMHVKSGFKARIVESAEMAITRKQLCNVT